MVVSVAATCGERYSLAMATPDVPARLADSSAAVPHFAVPLENGDRLPRCEFERRYLARSDIKKAELIEGVVYMPSPVRAVHAEKHADLQGWLRFYSASTPDVSVLDNASVRLDLDNEPQPDILMRIESSTIGNYEGRCRRVCGWCAGTRRGNRRQQRGLRPARQAARLSSQRGLGVHCLAGLRARNRLVRAGGRRIRTVGCRRLWRSQQPVFSGSASGRARHARRGLRRCACRTSQWHPIPGTCRVPATPRVVASASTGRRCRRGRTRSANPWDEP